MSETVNVADRVPQTEAEGPGKRFALWVQGCPLRCPGCCNQHMLEFRDEQHVTVDALAEEILSTPDIEGVTFLGGEPFSQAESLGKLARRVRRSGLSVMVFSGFTIEQLRQRPEAALLLAETDLLVDGPYLEDQLVTDKRWIGSANQRTHFLSDRYQELAATEEGWDSGSNTVEIRIVDGQIHINGFPSDGLEELLAVLNASRE